MRHWLKTWPQFFQAVFDGVKTFEVRRDDRGFELGDTLYLQEYHPANGYTGRLVGREVTYILRSGEGDFGIEPGFVVMGLRKIQLSSLSSREPEAAPETTLYALLGELHDALGDGDPIWCGCARTNGREAVVAPHSGHCLGCRARAALAGYAAPHANEKSREEAEKLYFAVQNFFDAYGLEGVTESYLNTWRNKCIDALQSFRAGGKS
jgi:hypothetical protein